MFAQRFLTVTAVAVLLVGCSRPNAPKAEEGLTNEAALKLLQDSVDPRTVVTKAVYQPTPETEKGLKPFIEGKRLVDARKGNVFTHYWKNEYIDHDKAGWMVTVQMFVDAPAKVVEVLMDGDRTAIVSYETGLILKDASCRPLLEEMKPISVAHYLYKDYQVHEWKPFRRQTRFRKYDKGWRRDQLAVE